MAESGVGKSHVDIDTLKETLCAQQRLLQKLYNELDAEREASSTAASEALSMILRLQGEKAAVKMEAEQYKRLVEEKMFHAEESLAIFEDIMYQKEMEVAALDYQVQAYRYKLLSMGCADPGIGEIKFSENFLQRNETIAGDISLQSLGRRNSAPPLPLKFLGQKKGMMEKESSLCPETDLVTKTMEDGPGQDISDLNSDWEKKTDPSTAGCINSYLEQIRKLDGCVKEIAGVSYANLRSSTRSPSPFSQRSSGSSSDLIKGAISNDMELVKHPRKLLESEITDSACSPCVLDVFEVPQADQDHNALLLQTRNQEKMALQGEDKLQTPDSLPDETVKPSMKADIDWIKKILRENNYSRPSDAAAVDCNLAIVRPISSISETEPRLHHLNKNSEIVEVENHPVKQASTNNNREEELKLLNEIREQLNSIQCDIRSMKSKKSSPRDELSFAILMEEMLHFWL